MSSNSSIIQLKILERTTFSYNLENDKGGSFSFPLNIIIHRKQTKVLYTSNRLIQTMAETYTFNLYFQLSASLFPTWLYLKAWKEKADIYGKIHGHFGDIRIIVHVIYSSKCAYFRVKVMFYNHEICLVNPNTKRIWKSVWWYKHT